MRVSPPRRKPSGAFTLIEVLVVLAIIGILAALLLPVSHGVGRARRLKVAQAELNRIGTAIAAYQAKRGHFPPDNPGRPELNQLFFELKGTILTNIAGQDYFATLDGTCRIAANAVNTLFGPNVSGFVNFPKGGGGDDGIAPQQFLTDLSPNQVGHMVVGTETLPALLVCSVQWTYDLTQQIIPTTGNPHATEPGLNPWRYVLTSPTHNPATYDLWVDLMIGGKKYRVSNWKTEPELL